MSNSISDQKVIDTLKAGEPGEKSRVMAWLYQQHFKAVRKYVLTNNGSAQDAADMFQDSLVIFFLRVKKGEYRYESNIGTYLYAVARNLWLKKLRRARLDSKEILTEESYTFDEESVLQGRQLTVREALGQIGENCRRLLTDFYFHKIPMSRLKELHHVGSEEAARNKKYRCMQKLLAFVKEKKLKRSDFKDE